MHPDPDFFVFAIKAFRPVTGTPRAVGLHSNQKPYWFLVGNKEIQYYIGVVMDVGFRII